MPGLLTHLIVALVGAVIIYLISNWKFGVCFAFGHIIPDVIKFGIPGMKMRTMSFYEIVASDMFNQIRVYSDSFLVWILVCLFVLVILFGLYKLGKMTKKKFYKLSLGTLIILSGVILHLTMDIFIIEKNYLI